MKKITPLLWFNFNAEEAVAFYRTVFPNSDVIKVTRNGEKGPGPKGSALTIVFRLEDQEFVALNAGPQFPFTEAISLSVDVRTQAEVDELWSKLTADGGRESDCGWLKDKFGLSWQIVPRVLIDGISSPDSGRAQRVMSAMMTMRKLDVVKLQQAYDGN